MSPRQGRCVLFDLLGDKRTLAWVLQFWPVLLISLVSAWYATALCRKWALRLGIVDRPDAQVKTHKKPVAYLGGVGILVGVVLGALMGLGLGPGGAGLITRRLLGIIVGAALACGVGLVDDLWDLRPRYKCLGQIGAACVLVLVGLRPSSGLGVSMPYRIGLLLDIGLTLFVVLGATNSLNLLDGLDGLCGGVTAVMTLPLFLLITHLAMGEISETSRIGDSTRVVVCLALAGGVLGFLPYNRHPARIFMGDAGSLLLGYGLAVLMLLLAEHHVRWWLSSLVIFGLPILDTAVALVRRWLNKRPLFVSDRGHIYDQMMDRGLPLKKTVHLCYALTALYGVIGLLISQMPTDFALVAFGCVVLASGLTVTRMGFLQMKGHRGAVNR
jgi:UDP-GlcNAc:undecaprenyl-phosphate/decaprenyl-phosphate GlcNAc-1-phosphate transferase